MRSVLIDMLSILMVWKNKWIHMVQQKGKGRSMTLTKGRMKVTEKFTHHNRDKLPWTISKNDPPVNTTIIP